MVQLIEEMYDTYSKVAHKEYVKSMNKDVIVLIMGKKEIVEDLENILSVPGIDMV